MLNDESHNIQYVRFGALPKEGRSLNYRKLRPDDRDLTTDLPDGKSPMENFLWLIKNTCWGNRYKGVDDVFEKGVSVFEADSNGMPRLDTLTQAFSMAIRLNEDYYAVTGDKIGTGQDGEPIITNAKAKKLNVSIDELVAHLINTLKNNYDEVIEDLECEEESLQRIRAGKDPGLHMFYDWEKKEHKYCFLNWEFRKPKSKEWDEDYQDCLNPIEYKERDEEEYYAEEYY